MVARLIAGALAVLAMSTTVQAQNGFFDPAAAFGARPSVLGIRMAPDGKSVAYIGPTKGPGTAVVTLGLDKGASPHVAATANGNPLRITQCSWVTSDRLVCDTVGFDKNTDPVSAKFAPFVPYTRKLSFDANGGNTHQLAQLKAMMGMATGGDILDSLPAEGAVLMTHLYNDPPSQESSRASTRQNGLSVESIDTRTLAIKNIEPAKATAVFYLADGHGNVRLMAEDPSKEQGGGFGGFGRGAPPPAAGAPAAGARTINYLFRAPGSKIWQKLAKAGFRPAAIDAEQNLAYGFQLKDGRQALYSVKLDDSLAEELVYARDDVDVTGLVQVGRQQKVIGASYTAKTPGVHYVDPQLEQLSISLMKPAEADKPLVVADASEDLNKLLLLAASDTDPGVYYLFDRAAKHLDLLIPVRKALEGVTLASVKAVSYPAMDGATISASLLVPPGKDSAKGLPAVVLSDASTAARDAQGFDWLAQFLVNCGYAVLLPGARGSEGGELWSQKAYTSWSVAVGDVVAGAQWLVSTGVADPKKLAAAGWASGGYAALQASVVAPELFKAVIAISPVTDLSNLNASHRMAPDAAQVASFVGSGNSVREGSPLERAGAIKAAVLVFHGGADVFHPIGDSKSLDAKLNATRAKHELVTWDVLDAALDDTDARTEVLRKSEAFLRGAL